MSFKSLSNILLVATLLAAVIPVFGEPQPVVVEAARQPGQPWKPYPTRTLQDLPADLQTNLDTASSQYGGILAVRTNATGFFHAAQFAGRSWLVDPEGCLYLSKGVTAVNLLPTPGATAAFKEKFGTKSNWVAQTSELLRGAGFNSIGAWSDTASFRAAAKPVPYTLIWNFMSSYGKKRGGTYQQPGHTGYPNNCIFVFDPGFESFCDDYAKQLVAVKNDPWLLGNFSDNEMPLQLSMLTNYLTLPETDPGQQAAAAWLRGRHGADATIKDVTKQDFLDFQGYVVQRYFQIVSHAVHNYDPNHLFLGSRFHGPDVRCPDIFRAAGPYVDVISVNCYREWTPDAGELAMWARESGRPFIITEFYAKAVDSGRSNIGGAGWLVKTQPERGLFYENFTLALLECKDCVGWHWFKYADNDPEETNTDPSNRDANKGIVDNRYAPYPALLGPMRQINERAYTLAEYFARTKRPDMTAASPPAK